MAWWDEIGSLSRAAADWLNRTSAAGAGALNRGGEAILPGSTPPGAPGYVPPPAPPAAPSGSGGSTTELGRPPAAPDAAPAAAAAAPGAPATPPSTLEHFNKQRGDVENAIAAAEAAISADPNSEAGVNASKALPALRTLLTTVTAQIAAEENRIRDDEKAKAAEKDKAKNGDSRTTRTTWKDAQGRDYTAVITETYNNGQWSYVPGSAKPDTGILGQPSGPGTSSSVITDGQGAYWAFDPYTKQITAINGPAAAAKTVTDPDGSVYLQKPDGTKGQKLFESLPQTLQTTDGRLVGYDKRTGQQIFNLDTQTPEGRALADRLQKATVEAAELANQPKFGGAGAQYQAEASRRQDLARTELKRLTDLQKSGQISPDQAEAQFDRWMQLNVEGPLAGYKAAAEEERRKLEQENLTRTTAEQGRVDTLNRQREQLAHAAGEAGRQEAITLGQGTRATEYISDLGGLANRMAAGPIGGPNAAAPFQFSAGAFDPANFRKVVPNVNELADAAVNRLLARVSPATARDVNVPLPALPTGPDLTSLMNQVRYSGPLSAAPQSEVPEIAAQDLGPSGQPGRARTVWSNGRYQDWDIPQS